MTCKDCIHQDVCYKRESVPDENYADKCGYSHFEKDLERPQGDLISREALLKRVDEERKYLKARGQLGAEHILVHNFRDLIDNAPTVEPNQLTQDIIDKVNVNIGLAQPIKDARPQGEWIPVSERLPADRDWYLGVFREPDTGFIGLPYICDYMGVVTKGTTKEGWILRGFTDIDDADDYIKSLECIAWQPLPEPYKDGGEEE